MQKLVEPNCSLQGDGRRRSLLSAFSEMLDREDRDKG